MSSFEQKNAQLLKSIAEAKPDVLREALAAMRKDSSACLIHASARFLVSVLVTVPVDNVEEDDSEDDNEESDPDEEREPKRQKREHDTVPVLLARYRKCRQCKEVFDIAQNHDAACKTHEGEKQIDENFFPDDDDITWGDGPSSIDVDNDWRVEERPEGSHGLAVESQLTTQDVLSASISQGPRVL